MQTLAYMHVFSDIHDLGLSSWWLKVVGCLGLQLFAKLCVSCCVACLFVCLLLDAALLQQMHAIINIQSVSHC